MSELKTKTLRVHDSTKIYLSRISKAKKIKIVDAVDYLVGLAETYDLFEADWKDRLVEDQVADFKKKMDEKKDARLESEKIKTSLKIKRDLLLKYIDRLDKKDGLEFIESVMGEIKDPNFLDSLADMDVVIVDGKRRLIKMKDGAPVFPNIDPDKIVTCGVGYHVIDAFCSCPKWRDCDIRKEEYTKFLVRTRRVPPSQRPPSQRRSRGPYHR